MSTSLRRVAALLLAGALLATACSEGPGGGEEDASENPEAALSEALDAFSDYEGVTLVMSLTAGADDIAAADIPADVAEKIVNSSITISGTGSTLEDQEVSMTFNVGGNEDAVEMRVIKDSVYLRAEVSDLVQEFGGDMAMIDAAAQQFAAQGMDFAQAAVDGEWIGIENAAAALEQIAGPQPTPDPEKAAEFGERIAGILESNADVTSEGSDDVGEHLVATLPVKETAEEFLDAIEGLGTLPPGTVPTEGLEDLPEADIPIDVWIADGQLVQVELDFVAIGRALGEEPTEGIDELGLRLEIAEFDDPVEAPADFVPIDLQEIMQGIFGAVGGGASAGGSPPLSTDRKVVLPELGLACEDLQTLSPDEIKAFLDASLQPKAFAIVRKKCPELFQ